MISRVSWIKSSSWGSSCRSTNSDIQENLPCQDSINFYIMQKQAWVRHQLRSISSPLFLLAAPRKAPAWVLICDSLYVRQTQRNITRFKKFSLVVDALSFKIIKTLILDKQLNISCLQEALLVAKEWEWIQGAKILRHRLTVKFYSTHMFPQYSCGVKKWHSCPRHQRTERPHVGAGLDVFHQCDSCKDIVASKIRGYILTYYANVNHLNRMYWLKYIQSLTRRLATFPDHGSSRWSRYVFRFNDGIRHIKSKTASNIETPWDMCRDGTCRRGWAHISPS